MRTLFEHSPVAARALGHRPSPERGPGRNVLVRRTIATALLGGVMFSGAVASAEEPIVVADDAVVAAPAAPAPAVTTQSTTTTTVTSSTPTVAAPVAPVAPVVAAPPVFVAPPAPVQPLVAPTPTPLPPQAGYQGPIYFNGPVWITPAQPGVQQVLPPQLPPPPVYVAPPVLRHRPLYIPPLRRYTPSRPSTPVQRGPVVGLGARFTALGVSNQEVFGKKVNLVGGGIQVRFRNQGHWGFELGMDALRTSIADSAFVRSSYPFTFAPMLYLRKNRHDTHFNIYGVAGFGLMSDNIVLYQESAQERKQQFWEVMGQVGGGIEIRFTHLALFADMRAVGMLLDDSTQAGQFYQNIDGGPVPASSFGYKANIGGMLWF